MGRVRAYVGLGSNVGDASATLAAAVGALADLPGVEVVGVSRLYATAPVGVVDQPEFRNAVVALDLTAAGSPSEVALDLLARLKALERAFGRADGPRWGPRPLDLDILVLGDVRLAVERPPGLGPTSGDRGSVTAGEPPPPARLLEVPHPEASERLFVLAPLTDLAADLVPPGWDRSVAAVAGDRARIEGPDAVRVVGEWDAEARAWRPTAAGGPAA